MPTSVINKILSFCPQGTIASGDIMALEDYKNDMQRLRGHQPGIARRELENMALRQSSFVTAGLAQFVAKRYAPGVRDDANLDTLETAITAAITALIAASNAQTTTRLATKRTIGGVAFDGSTNIHHYATCSTAAATAAKTIALTGFALATGARVLVKFTVTNNATNPTLDVNGASAKPIQYRGAAIAAGTLATNRTYEFIYTDAQYELVGDVGTNTTYPLATASNDGLMTKDDKSGLDGIAVDAEVNQNAFDNILVDSTTIATDTKTDTLTFVAETNMTLTPDTANDKLTIAAKGATYAAATQSVAGLMSAANKKSVDYCEALHLSMIGVPRYQRSTSLPANHVWANGDLVLFSDWPELKKVYDGGGFTGMLLAYNATSTTIAANLGKWRPNAANPTGLYIPKLSDQFFRAWTGGAGREAGGWQEDTMRNITGRIVNVVQGLTDNTVQRAEGAFYPSGAGAVGCRGEDLSIRHIHLDTSLVVPTGPEDVPPHVWQPVAVYLGLQA